MHGVGGLLVTKRTEWFDVKDDNPIRIGWYEYVNECRGNCEVIRVHWNGEFWSYYNDRRKFPIYIGDMWRGLVL